MAGSEKNTLNFCIVRFSIDVLGVSPLSPWIQSSALKLELSLSRPSASAHCMI